MNVEHIIKTDKKIPLNSRTILQFMLINTKIKDGISAALKPFEVSGQQFNVLRILRGQNGKPANLNTLNERMVTKMSNTTRLVDKLILKGFVSREVCSSNRRKVEIIITEKGEMALKKMDLAVKQAEKKVLSPFNKQELEQLNILLNKF